jgi:phospholipid transport system substrate-binding protein
MGILIGRRGGLRVALVFALAVAALPARGGETDPSVAPVQKLVDALLRIMKAGMGTPFSQRFAMLAPVIDGTFDLKTVLQNSIGSGWATLSPDQQRLLLESFRRYTVASYVNSFNSYDGQRLVVKPNSRTVAPGQQVVETDIVPVSGDGHELDYVMHQTSDGWRIVDVLADGAVSRVAVQRSDFRRLLSNGGAQALASSLQSKSTDLSDGQS